MKLFLGWILAIVFGVLQVRALEIPKLNFAKFKDQKNKEYLWYSGGFTASSATIIDDATASTNVSGIIALAAEYERFLKEDFSAGLQAKYSSTSDSAKPSGKIAVNTLGLGAFVRFHIPINSWDFYLNPGFHIITASAESPGVSKQNSGISLGYSHTIGIAFHYDNDWVVAIENQKTYGLGGSINGVVGDDLLFKVRTNIPWMKKNSAQVDLSAE
ncbi:MAG: hypothetical protein AB8E15_04160 [Bdellovibrionales bacterium]